MVCYPAKIDLKSNCEANSISGVSNVGCQFQVMCRSNDPIAVYRDNMHSSEVVLVGYIPVEIVTRCLGQSAVSSVISGPHVMHIKPNCSIETNHWRIRGVQTMSSNITLRFRQYPSFPPLNVSWHSLPPRSLIQAINLTGKVPIAWDDIPELIAPTFSVVELNTWQRYKMYFVSALCIVILVAGIAFAVYLFSPSGPCHRRCFRSWPEVHATLVPAASTADSSKTVTYRPAFATADTSVQGEAFEMTPIRSSNPYGQARSLLDNALENWTQVSSFLEKGEGCM